jgi:hypothetical protein
MMKRLLTLVLLAFVGVSVGYMIWDGARGSGTEPAAMSEAGEAGEGHVTVVYYFHGTKRCHTCRTIEALTREAVESAYSSELAAGAVELRTVNVDEPENEHFVSDYELSMRSVVLVEVVDGVEKRWQRLDEVWQLVDDRDAFVDYIIDNADGFVRRQG